VRIAIIQSCYVPWRGFFDLISRCDLYVIYDQVQYAKRHWHNRNRIKTAAGLEWLTIPVITKGRYTQRIDEVEIERPWVDKHWRSMELAYRHTPFFEALAPTIRGWYDRAAKQSLLTQVNVIFLEEIARLLGLHTRIVRDTTFPAGGEKTERLVAIARAAGADCYLSGPSAKAYLDETLFAEAGIAVEWMDYSGYRDYPQLNGSFEAAVSVLDLLFNVGMDAPRYLGRNDVRLG
jgi:WbqC-like protein family